MDKVIFFFISSGTPVLLWGEAVSTAIYLINMSTSTVIDFKTPIKLWTGT